MILLELHETATEYLLSIPPSQKERAKAIEGRRWDPSRKCWVYPRNRRSYDALLAEFGDEFVRIEVTRPKLPDESQKSNGLIQDFAELEKRLLEHISASSHDEKSKITQLMVEAEESKRQIAVLELDLEESKYESEQLESNLRKAQERIDQLMNSGELGENFASFSEQLKELAIESTGNDSEFRRFISSMQFDKTLPLEVAKKVEAHLRTALDANSGDRFVDLISIAQESDDLTPHAADLAHAIRKQRNLVAHAEIYEPTYLARSAMCLFATALLWPEMPELSGD